MSAIHVLLLCVAFICLSDLTSGADLPLQPNCQDARNINCEIYYKPLCGSDGHTHSNICAYCIVKRSATSPLNIVKYEPC